MAILSVTVSVIVLSPLFCIINALEHGSTIRQSRRPCLRYLRLTYVLSCTVVVQMIVHQKHHHHDNNVSLVCIKGELLTSIQAHGCNLERSKRWHPSSIEMHYNRAQPRLNDAANRNPSQAWQGNQTNTPHPHLKKGARRRQKSRRLIHLISTLALL